MSVSFSPRVEKLTEGGGFEILVEAEYEFFNYRETSMSVKERNGVDLEHMTPGMFGYSLTRPTQNQDFYYGIFDACRFTSILFLPFYSYLQPVVFE